METRSFTADERDANDTWPRQKWMLKPEWKQRRSPRALLIIPPMFGYIGKKQSRQPSTVFFLLPFTAVSAQDTFGCKTRGVAASAKAPCLSFKRNY